MSVNQIHVSVTGKTIVKKFHVNNYSKITLVAPKAANDGSVMMKDESKGMILR